MSMTKNYLKDKMEFDAVELMVKGEQLCNRNEIALGIKCYETSLIKGLKDKDLLMDLHNKLGNAYFSISDYDKALINYKKAADLAKSVENLIFESISIGNISSAFKMLGKFEEAIIQCQLQIKNFKKLDDKLQIANALYNMGNIYYDNAKAYGALSRPDIYQFPIAVENLLENAAYYYKESMKVNKKIDNKILLSTILGNYANVHYLLSNFKKSIKLNTDRLQLAIDLENKESELRTYINRANCYFTIRNFESAIKDYKSALNLARSEKNDYCEWKMLYVLSNTFYIVKEFINATENMLNFRTIMKNNGNKIGEARGNLCLSIIYSEMRDYTMAKVYAENYLQISKLLNNAIECIEAGNNLRRINDVIQYYEDMKLSINDRFKSNLIVLPQNRKDILDFNTIVLPDFVNMDDLIKPTNEQAEISTNENEDKEESLNDFFALLAKYQNEKIKQRNVKFDKTIDEEQFINYTSSSKKIFLDTLITSQSRRLDDQRADMTAFNKKLF